MHHEISGYIHDDDTRKGILGANGITETDCNTCHHHPMEKWTQQEYYDLRRWIAAGASFGAFI